MRQRDRKRCILGRYFTAAASKDPSCCFRDLTGAITVHELREDGVGAIVKQASLVTPEEENSLWLGINTKESNNSVYMCRSLSMLFCVSPRCKVSSQCP